MHGHEYWSCINLYIRASHDDESTEVCNARSVIEGLGNIYVCMWINIYIYIYNVMGFVFYFVSARAHRVTRRPS